MLAGTPLVDDAFLRLAGTYNTVEFRAVEMLLLQIDPGEPASEQAGRNDRLVGADAERALRMRVADEMGEHISQRYQPEDDPDRCPVQNPVSPLGCGQPAQVNSSLVAKILLRSVPAGSLKKASVRLAWFCEIASSGSGRITARVQAAGRSFTAMFSSSV